MIYRMLKNKIEKQNYQNKEEVQDMLDVFYVGGRITKEQYLELTKLLEPEDKAN